MSKKIICDVCKNETLSGRHLECEIEKRTSYLLFFTIYDEKYEKLDICDECWDKLYNLVKPILKLDKNSSSEKLNNITHKITTLKKAI